MHDFKLFIYDPGAIFPFHVGAISRIYNRIEYMYWGGRKSAIKQANKLLRKRVKAKLCKNWKIFTNMNMLTASSLFY